MDIEFKNNGVLVGDFPINLDATLDCGQAFRWEKEGGVRRGVVKGVPAFVEKTENGIFIKNIGKREFYDVFYDYFDIDADYDEILSVLKKDEFLLSLIKKYGVIRILNQEPWETLCSFIISSCNNIPRIKSIIEKMSEKFGEETGGFYSFPEASALSALNENDFGEIKAGFRTKYIIEAAKIISSGEIDLESLKKKPLSECEKELMKIPGVGKKIADCVCLFSLKRKDAFPVDRHIKRALEKYYPRGLPPEFNKIKGVAQQYLYKYSLDEK